MLIVPSPPWIEELYFERCSGIRLWRARAWLKCETVAIWMSLGFESKSPVSAHVWLALAPACSQGFQSLPAITACRGHVFVQNCTLRWPSTNKQDRGDTDNQSEMYINYQRKFKSQTSNNIGKWKTRGGKIQRREKMRREHKRWKKSEEMRRGKN